MTKLRNCYIHPSSVLETFENYVLVKQNENESDRESGLYLERQNSAGVKIYN